MVGIYRRPIDCLASKRVTRMKVICNLRSQDFGLEYEKVPITSGESLISVQQDPFFLLLRRLKYASSRASKALDPGKVSLQDM